MNILFFGSTSDSVLVLETLPSVVAVVTQPPKPVGREKIMTPTPVELWAKSHTIPVLSFATQLEKPWLFEDDQQVINALQSLKPDLVISASFGAKIPASIIKSAQFGGLNIHPSILPRWRGGDPVPWAIVTGDAQIGVSVVSIEEQFDAGLLYAQQKIPIKPHDTSTPLRTHLFALGAALLAELLPNYLAGKAEGKKQKIEDEPKASRLTREMGFEPIEKIMDPNESERINKKYRAFHPWPGLWTILNQKRVKILEFTHAPVTVQLEGKNPVSWAQFQTAYITPNTI